MNVADAIENALTFLESLGYKKGGDIHDDLAAALEAVRSHPTVANEPID